MGSISLVGGQQHFCFTALITGPNRQQLEPALQTSMGLTSHNGILQYCELSLQCFSKHGRRRWNVCGLMFGFKVYLHYYLSCILCDESRHGEYDSLLLTWQINMYFTSRFWESHIFGNFLKNAINYNSTFTGSPCASTRKMPRIVKQTETETNSFKKAKLLSLL